MGRLLVLKLFLCCQCGVANDVCSGAGCSTEDDQTSLLTKVSPVHRHQASTSPYARSTTGSEILYVYSFTRYFNYEGPINLYGSMEIETSGTTQSLGWHLFLPDLNCGQTPYPNGEVSNDCGIHIHQGTSCTEAAGGHFYAGDSDPWTAVHYEATDGMSGHTGTVVNSGFLCSQILDHVVVVHDISGARIACGKIQRRSDAATTARTLVVKSFSPYYGYDGPLKVSGTMQVSTPWPGLETDGTWGKQLLDWNLAGADGNCGLTQFPNGEISNDCGIHIHTGTTCDGDAGGHYYNTTSDPWTAVHYFTSNGQSSGTGVRVATGLRLEEIVGHAMVVHDITGGRVACGIIEKGTLGGQCYIEACGCPPFSGAPTWCSAEESTLTSEWCNAGEKQCEQCHGAWCTR